MFCFFFVPSYTEAVVIELDPAVNYGIVNQKGMIEVPALIDPGLAQAIASLFTGSSVYIKITDPTPAFVSSPSMATLDAFASGWYITLKPNNASDAFIGTLDAKTAKPIVVEVVPPDTAFVRDIKTKHPQILLHTGGFVYWPREEVKGVLEQVAPPTLEAISFQAEDPITSDMFDSVKLIFDTFFDASNDIPGTSIKIHYPSGTVLSLSDIRPFEKFDDTKKTAWRMAIASCATTTSIQTQKKPDKKAPIRYINLGAFADLSQSGRIIAARYAKFLSLQPELTWPLAVAGNGGPYDAPKPIAGVIGNIQGQSEGILINTSPQQTPVSLPFSTGSKAYSSLIGSFNLTASFQLSPYETVVFGDTISNSLPSPSCAPTTPPIAPTFPPEPTTPAQKPGPVSPQPLVPTTAPRQNPTPLPFTFGFPQQNTPLAYPTPQPIGKVTSLEDGIRLSKHYARYAIIKIDPLLRFPITAARTVKQADMSLESSIQSFWQMLVTHIQQLLQQTG
ncbi:MAG: hypothetical protein WC489_01060 [Patescibacteria group bacterium]